MSAWDQLLNAAAGQTTVRIESELAPAIEVNAGDLIDPTPGIGRLLSEFARPKITVIGPGGVTNVVAPYGEPRPGLWLLKTAAPVLGLVVLGYVVGRISR